MNAEQNDQLLNKFEVYLRILKRLQASSVGRYRSHISEFLTWQSRSAQKVLLAISKADVEAYLQHCRSRGNGARIRLAKLSALRNLFGFLVYEKILSTDPTAGIPSPAPDNTPVRVFSRDEVYRLFAAVDPATEKGVRDIVFLVLGVFCGLRANEIAQCSVSDIANYGKNVYITIPNRLKQESRTIPLWRNPGIFVLKLLAARISQGAHGKDPLIIPYYKNGKPRGNRRIALDALDDLIKTIAHNAGIEKPAPATIHLLRSTHARDLQHIEGMDLSRIMQRMGWRQVGPAARYLIGQKEIYRKYKSLKEYWGEFNKIWSRPINRPKGDI